MTGNQTEYVFFDMHMAKTNDCSMPLGTKYICREKLSDIFPETIYRYIFEHFDEFFTGDDGAPKKENCKLLETLYGMPFFTIMEIFGSTKYFYTISNIKIFKI